MKSNKYLISLPYLYPVCPISIDHARMFVVGDINARLQRKKGKDVCFPIAAHFSGVTAEKVSELLNKKINKDCESYEEKRKMYRIFSKIYKIPESILELLKSPQDILYYFTYQIVNDLKSINVSCDYDNFYTTDGENFKTFVKVMFDFYHKNKVLIKNDKNELALHYSNNKWKNKTLESINKVEFIQSFHKSNILGAFDNVREDFGILRDYGIGIKYNEEYVIDPMFDSDLFQIFDLYMKFKNEDKKLSNERAVFEEVFFRLNNNEVEKTTKISDKILEWLPCDLFVCEEHLKTWIVKRTYSETLLMRPKYRTKRYFITGMGKINNERMSSSRGTAILLKDLIEEYGIHNARLIILMTGGHPSKLYNYDMNLPKEVTDMTEYFKEYLNYVYSVYMKDKEAQLMGELVKERLQIEKDLELGYYKQAITYMMRVMPKSNRNLTPSRAKEILEIYKENLAVLLPGFLNVI